jgi:hypothetical protein
MVTGSDATKSKPSMMAATSETVNSWFVDVSVVIKVGSIYTQKQVG